MANSDSKVNQEAKEHFLLEEQYPDVQSILTVRPKTSADLHKSCIYVLDANAMLVPFQLGPHNLPQIPPLLNKLVEKDRLYLAARAVREFGRHRADKVREVYTTLGNRASQRANTSQLNLPMLSDSPKVKAVADALKELEQQQDKVCKALNDLRSTFQHWTWDDPISTFYRDHLADKIVDHDLTPERLIEDVQRRIKYRIPPGYKDAAKDDEGIGDVAIWHTMLRLGKEKGADVVFVTGETKADWVVGQGDVVLSPRFELVMEYRKVTGHDFGLVNFARLLKLLGADDAVVKAALSVKPYWSGLDETDDRVVFRGVIDSLNVLRSSVTELEHCFLAGRDTYGNLIMCERSFGRLETITTDRRLERHLSPGLIKYLGIVKRKMGQYLDYVNRQVKISHPSVLDQIIKKRETCARNVMSHSQRVLDLLQTELSLVEGGLDKWRVVRT